MQPYMQMCWVVPDLEAAVESWVTVAGVGPFFWFEAVPFTQGVHRGQAAQFPTSQAAIAYRGDMQIELVCQDNDEPGVFRDVFARGESGLHHVAVVTEDYEAERDGYVASGADVAFEGRIGTSRTCWIDTTSTLGFMVELLEPSATRQAVFDKMRSAAQEWDGHTRLASFG